VCVASRPSTRASKLPVTQLVFVARGVFPRSTPCVCALRGFLPGRVFPDRTTRRHGLARLLPDWVGLAGRVVTFCGAAGEEGDSTFLGVVAVRQPASEGTQLVLLPLGTSAAGGALQLQVWLSPARSMADGGGHGDPPGVSVPGVGGDGSSPPGGGSSVEDRHTGGGTTDAGAREQRTLFQPFPPGLDPTGTRPPVGAPSGSTHPEAAPSVAGTHLGGGQPPDVTTCGGGSVPPPARELEDGSSSPAPSGSRSAKCAPSRDQSSGTQGIGSPDLGPGGRSPLGAWDGVAMPDSAREPASWSSSRAPTGARGARDGQVLEWRDAVAEVVQSEVTRSLVTMLRGSMPRPAERRGRAPALFPSASTRRLVVVVNHGRLPIGGRVGRCGPIRCVPRNPHSIDGEGGYSGY